MPPSLKAKVPQRPWNVGKSIGQMAPFTKESVHVIRALLRIERKLQDLALLNVEIETMLRASDLLRLFVWDVTDHKGGVKEEIHIRQQKTNRGLSRLVL